MIAADKHCHNSSTLHRTMSTPTEGRPQDLTVLCCIEFEVLTAVTIELPGAQGAIVESFVCSYCVDNYWAYLLHVLLGPSYIFVTHIIGAYIFVAHLVLLWPICIFVAHIVFLESTYSLHLDSIVQIRDQLLCPCSLNSVQAKGGQGPTLGAGGLIIPCQQLVPVSSIIMLVGFNQCTTLLCVQNQIDQKISLNSAVTAFEIAQKSDRLLKCGGRLQIWRMKWGLAKIKNECKVVFGVSH